MASRPIRLLVPLAEAHNPQPALACALAWVDHSAAEIHVLTEASSDGADATSTRPDVAIVWHLVSRIDGAEIVRAAARLEADCIIVGGRVPDEVVRDAPCPVLYVGRRPTRPWHKVLCPIDFSESSRLALRIASGLARQLGAELLLLNVASDGREDADLSLASWRAEARRIGLSRVGSARVIGAAAGQIVEVARDEGCDVVVMGAHGRGAHLQEPLGSVARAVLGAAPCPVMTIGIHANLAPRGGDTATVAA